MFEWNVLFHNNFSDASFLKITKSLKLQRTLILMETLEMLTSHITHLIVL